MKCNKCGGPKRHTDGLNCGPCDRARGRIVIPLMVSEEIDMLTDPRSLGRPIEPLRGGLLS